MFLTSMEKKLAWAVSQNRAGSVPKFLTNIHCVCNILEFKFTFFHTLFLCICVFSTFLKALETFHLTLKKPPSDFCNQLLKTLWKLDNIDYWTIYTQEARKLHFPNCLVHFLLIFLSYMVCCTLFWTFIYHQDHVFFDWKCVLFLPFLLPHIIYFIRLF